MLARSRQGSALTAMPTVALSPLGAVRSAVGCSCLKLLQWGWREPAAASPPALRCHPGQILTACLPP